MTTPADGLGRKVRQLDNDVQSIYEMLASIQATQVRQGNRLDEISRSQEDLARVVGGHGSTLDEHGRKLDDQGRKLDEHGRKLDGHGAKLDEHGAKLDEHGAKLDRILALLER